MLVRSGYSLLEGWIEIPQDFYYLPMTGNSLPNFHTLLIKSKKIYQVTLDKPLTKNDEEAIREGLTLEDGLAEVDDLQVLSVDRRILGLEIHIGKNRIVRRIFAHLGYDVTALDRVLYAGLDKKDLKRGNYRFLSEKRGSQTQVFPLTWIMHWNS